MKKVYFLGAALLSSLTSFSQMKTEVYSFSKPAILSNFTENQKPASLKKGLKQQKAQGDVIWSEDFETLNGPLTTDNGSWTTNGTNSGFWTATDVHPLYAFSTTWISDLDGNFIAWNSTSISDPGATTSVDGSIESPTIQLAGINSVLLSFETEGYYCCNFQEAPFGISLSLDNGNTWSDTLKIDIGIERSQHSYVVGEPIKFSVNLDKFNLTLTDQTKLKFIWDGTNADPNGQKNTVAYWSIDNIELIENYDYELALEKLWLEDISTDFEHTDIPKKLAGKLNVMGGLRKIGSNIPTNVQLIVTVKDTINGGNVIATETGGVLRDDLVDEYDFITFKTNIDLSALDVNGYTVTAEISYVETDGNPDNNSLTRTLNITDSYLGQRVYDQFSTIGSAGRGLTSQTISEPMKVGNVMKITKDVDLHGLEVRIGNNNSYKTTVGEKLTVQVFEIDTAAASFQASFKNLDIARVFTITQGMLPTSPATSKFVLLNFDNSEDIVGPVTLAGNKFYLITVGHDGGNNKHFAYVYNAGDDDFSSRLYGDYGAEPGNNWFTLGDQIQTRMFFDFTAGIDEENTQSIKVGNIYPNPTTGETSINYNLVNASKVAVKVMDITGKVVYTESQANKTSGNHTLNINAAAFNSGVYYVTISTDEAQVTKKLIRK